MVERVEVVTGGASAAYGSDAIAGVVNFIMKKNFEGFQVDGQVGENQHDNHNGYVQNLVRQFWRHTRRRARVEDGRNKTFDVLMGTNFADGKGNVTAYLSYRHADPVASSHRDFGACQLDPNFNDPNGNVTGVACGGSSNSNWFKPFDGPQHRPLAVQRVRDKLRPLRLGCDHAAGVVQFPALHLHDARGRSLQRRVHGARRDHRLLPAVRRVLFHGRQDASAGRAGGSVQGLQSARSHGCRQLLHQLQQSAVERAAARHPLHAGADCGATLAPMPDARHGSTARRRVEIGRRNIEGGGRSTDFEHTNYRAVFGTKGDFADAWSYDVYGQYFYTTFFDSNQKYLNFQAITNALQVTGTAANPTCISGSSGLRSVQYLVRRRRHARQQLNYLY